MRIKGFFSPERDLYPIGLEETKGYRLTVWYERCSMSTEDKEFEVEVVITYNEKGSE